MKQKILPTQYERKLRSDDIIVSKTDTTGRITYCNRIFMEIAGYTEQELLGKQHNIIRHPDMPRGVFQLLWNTVEGGSEFFGYVKNMCRDGGYYWVFANVTPTYSPGGELIGYYSVRRKPREEAIAVVAPIYAEMLAAEKTAGPKNAIEASTRILQSKLADLGTNYEHFALEI